jgi:hypothetical protein
MKDWGRDWIMSWKGSKKVRKGEIRAMEVLTVRQK